MDSLLFESVLTLQQTSSSTNEMMTAEGVDIKRSDNEVVRLFIGENILHEIVLP